MNRVKLILAAVGLAVLGATANAADIDAAFLDFPMVEAVSAAKVPAFAWMAHQGDKTSVMFARGPEFRRVQLASRSDVDGDPIADLYLSPDGSRVSLHDRGADGGGGVQPGVPAPGVRSRPCGWSGPPRGRSRSRSGQASIRSSPPTAS